MMKDVSAFACEGERLKSIDLFKSTFCRMVRQTNECAYFIQNYADAHFGIYGCFLYRPQAYIRSIIANRLIENFISNTDIIISRYQESFKSIMEEFGNKANLHTSISVVRITDQLDDIGTTFCRRLCGG